MSVYPLYRPIPILISSIHALSIGFRPGPGSSCKEYEEVSGEGTYLSRETALYLAPRVSELPLEDVGRLFCGISPSAVSQKKKISRFDCKRCRAGGRDSKDVRKF